MRLAYGEYIIQQKYTESFVYRTLMAETALLPNQMTVAMLEESKE
jgi:hypothetical protein